MLILRLGQRIFCCVEHPLCPQFESIGGNDSSLQKQADITLPYTVLQRHLRNVAGAVTLRQ